MTRLTSDRLLLGLLTLLLAACGADHHAQQVIAAYKTAVEHKDTAALTRLTGQNMQASLDDHEMDRDDSAIVADAVLQHAFRKVTTSRGVLYLGWLKRDNSYLFPLLVGEPDALNQFRRKRDFPRQSTNDWRISILSHSPIGIVEKDAKRVPIEQALAKLDDQILIAYFFEGSTDAKNAVDQAIHP
jgi:hypothetical protein